MSARRLPGIRKPDPDETPLSAAEQWVAVRESRARPRHEPEPEAEAEPMPQAEPMPEAGPRGEAWL